MKNSTIAVGIAALVLAAAAAFFLARQQTSSEASADTASRADGGGDAQVDIPGSSTPTTSDVANPSAAVAPATSYDGETLAPAFHSVLSQHRLIGAMHAAFDQEPRDEAWASHMEQQWLSGFAGNVELATYGTPTAHCRSTRCEVRLLTPVPSQREGFGWAQLLGAGVGVRLEGDPAPASHPIQGAAASAETDGTTAVLMIVQYAREAPRVPAP